MAHWKLVLTNWWPVCQRGFKKLLDRFFSPVSQDEDNRRREILLRAVLVVSFFLGLVCLVIVLIDAVSLGSAYRGISWVSVALIPGFFALLLILLRRGWLRTASAGVFLAFLIPSLYCSARWGIDLPVALLSDAFLIVMTSVLFGIRAAFLSSIGIGLALFSFSWLDIKGILRVERYWHLESFALDDALAIISILLCLAFLCQLAHREIERSLKRARSSEKLLREERDLLEIRVTERTRELRQTQLEQITQLHRFVEFGRMATGFFHDLASPLGAIALNLDLLKQAGLKEHKEASVHLQRAEAATSRLGSFLQDVRRHIHQDSGDEHFSASDVLTSVLEVVEYHARNAGVAVECNVEGEINISGNGIKFHKVLMNLIWNAVDACAGLDSKKARVEVNIRQQDEQVVVTVSDGGVGISPENLERIWEPFYTTKPSSQGMGIGLTVCRRVIEDDFNGSISCTSTLGQGTVFTVTLHTYGSGSPAVAATA